MVYNMLSSFSFVNISETLEFEVFPLWREWRSVELAFVLAGTVDILFHGGFISPWTVRKPKGFSNLEYHPPTPFNAHTINVIYSMQHQWST